MRISRFYDELHAEKTNLAGTCFVSRWAKKKLILVSGKNKVAQNDVLGSYLRYIKPKTEKNVYFLSDILTFPKILHENSHILLQVLFWEAGKLEVECLPQFLLDFKISKVPTIIIDDEDEVTKVYLQLFKHRAKWGRVLYLDCDIRGDERKRIIMFKLAIIGKELSEKALNFIVKLPLNSVFAILKLLERLPVKVITLKDLHTYELFWGDYEIFLSDLLFQRSAGAVLQHSLDNLDSSKLFMLIGSKLDMICKVKTEEGTNVAVASKLKVTSSYVYEIRKAASRMSLRVALKRLRLVLTLMRYRSKVGVVGSLLLYW